MLKARSCLRPWLLGFLIMLFLNGVPAPQARAQEKTEQSLCAVYITGNGCSNCALTDPALFTEATALNPNLVILEYEIYRTQQDNMEVKDQYFQNYIPRRRPGVPFLIWGERKTAVGRIEVLKAVKQLTDTRAVSPCALPDGSSKAFEELDVGQLPGRVNIWTQNRLLISENTSREANPSLRRIVKMQDISRALEGSRFETAAPKPFEISQGKVDFEYAVKIADWVLQWNGDPLSVRRSEEDISKNIAGIFMLLVLCGILFTFFEVERAPAGFKIKFRLGAKMKDCLTVGVSVLGLVLFFIFAGRIPPDLIEKSGYSMPLPVFTFLIGLVDGFNPCNMFVLTCLLGLLVSTSSTRQRLYLVGFCFVFVVFLFYFLFMAAWLNVFKYMGFITPLRIALALIALIAGTINCKEILFFKKGVSLTIQDQHKGPLFKKMRDLRARIEKGSLFVLLGSAISLAVFSSLIELLCTAGFPIIYTGILTGKGLKDSLQYYLYLIYYNLVYVLPLAVIVFVIIHTFKATHVTQRQVEIMKYIGGIIMILLGLVLLINPMLLGIAVQ
ncbi:MAG TPA: hypothetical protein PLT76_10320 [Candidatus Omnitrophota bacterium]|nr:hypothetical protein [Candidatus Omnitrophota bacterium]HQO59094.1 hypothetical protein [Candidatus Omnitrophota bacterium]